MNDRDMALVEDAEEARRDSQGLGAPGSGRLISKDNWISKGWDSPSSGCQGTTVEDVTTGEVRPFGSLREAARHMGVTASHASICSSGGRLVSGRFKVLVVCLLLLLASCAAPQPGRRPRILVLDVAPMVTFDGGETIIVYYLVDGLNESSACRDVQAVEELLAHLRDVGDVSVPRAYPGIIR